jgi:hypothetical protein
MLDEVISLLAHASVTTKNGNTFENNGYPDNSADNVIGGRVYKVKPCLSNPPRIPTQRLLKNSVARSV